MGGAKLFHAFIAEHLLVLPPKDALTAVSWKFQRLIKMILSFSASEVWRIYSGPTCCKENQESAIFLQKTVVEADSICKVFHVVDHLMANMMEIPHQVWCSKIWPQHIKSKWCARTWIMWMRSNFFTSPVALTWLTYSSLFMTFQTMGIFSRFGVFDSNSVSGRWNAYCSIIMFRESWKKEINARAKFSWNSDGRKRSEDGASDLWFAALAVAGALITFEIADELFAALHGFSPDQDAGEFGLELREDFDIHFPYEKREKERETQLGQWKQLRVLSH